MIWSLPLLIIAGLLLPLAAWNIYRLRSRGSPSPEEQPSIRGLAVQTTAVQAVVFLSALLALAGREFQISVRSEFTLLSVAAALCIIAAALAAAWLESRAPLKSGDVLRRKLREAGLTAPWLAAMVAAAVAEEFAYRGALFLVLGEYLGPIPAALASALLFGLAHLAQGWRGFWMSGAFGLAMQWLCHLSGGLTLAMLTHLLYDLAAAWFGRRLSRRERRDLPH